MRFTGEKKGSPVSETGLGAPPVKKSNAILSRGVEHGSLSENSRKKKAGKLSSVPLAEISQVFWGMHLLISQASTSKLRRCSRVEPRRRQSLYSQRCRLGQRECVFPLHFLRRTAVFRFGRELRGVSQEQRHLS